MRARENRLRHLLTIWRGVWRESHHKIILLADEGLSNDVIASRLEAAQGGSS
jgi:hypothetical protein